jgi:hypothetical protein
VTAATCLEAFSARDCFRRRFGVYKNPILESGQMRTKTRPTMVFSLIGPK